jgi:hypothetical protein
MTDLADIAVRLFWAHDNITEMDVPEDWVNWDAAWDAERDAKNLNSRQKSDLLMLCLDIAVQFARTCEAALGTHVMSDVLDDASGRGWKTATRRSGSPWDERDPRSDPQLFDDRTAEEAEAMWSRLFDEGPPAMDDAA